MEQVTAVDTSVVTESVQNKSVQDVLNASEKAAESVTQSTETKPVETKTEPKPEEELRSSKLAAIAKRERELFQKEKAFKDREAKVKAYEQAKAKAKEDPFSWLAQAEVTVDDLVNHNLKSGKPQTLEEKLEFALKKIDQKEQQEKENEIKQKRQAEEAKVEEIKGNYLKRIDAEVESNLDKYEHIAVWGLKDEVFDTMNDIFIKTGKEITIAKACELVENEFERRATEGITRYKHKALFKSQGVQNSSNAGSENESVSASENRTTPSAKTLTNGLTPESSVKSNLPMDPDARKRALLAMLAKSAS